MHREEVISRLRRKLLEFTSKEKSACQAAADHGILCGGFASYTDRELRAAYRGIVKKNPSISRAALESEANRLQLDRQQQLGTLIACDSQQIVYETCRGWMEFDNAELERFYFELFGEEIAVL